MSNDAKKNPPTHIAYSVRDYEKNGESESAWTRIGAAWAHKDGKGFDITLENLPLSGRISLRTFEPKPQA